MKGLDILKSGHLEKVENGTTTLSLLGRGNGIELMKQSILKDNTFILFPSEVADAQEYFYILKGEIQAEIEKKVIILGSNDFLSSINL